MAESFRNAYASSVDFICSSTGVCVTAKQLEAILNEQMVKLAKDMKREKEEEITELQRELYWKETLEWVVETLKKGIKLWRDMNEEGDLATKNKLRPIEEDLKIQQCKLDGFKHKEEMLAKHQKELEMMQQKELEHLDTIFGVYKTSKQQSDDQLKLRKNKLRQLEKLDESFKRKLDPEKEMNDKAIQAQKKAEEIIMKLKKEKEQAPKKINVLQRELDQNQALEMEIETLKHDIKVMRHMIEERDLAAKSKLTAIEKELKDKQGELDYLEKINYQLIIQQLRDYGDLRKIRKALILSGSVIWVQQKDNETMTRLIEDLKREKEQSLDKINVLQRELDRKQALELEIETLKRDFEVMRQMNEEGHLATNKKLTSIEEELKDKQDELDYLENINNELIIKQRRDNDQVQEARKALINALKDTRCNICVKRMGELDQKPFICAAKQKYSKEEALGKALELCSLWEDHLRDPHWHPFKVIKNGEKYVGVIDEEDEKLVGLKNEYGDEVYVAVTTALMELNEYNSSGRYPVLSCGILSRKEKQNLMKG